MGTTLVKISIGYAAYPLSQIVGDDRRPTAAAGAAGEYGASGYYTRPGMPPGIWMGRGTGMVGRDAGTEASKSDVRMLFDGELDPATGKPLLGPAQHGKAPRPTPGRDGGTDTDAPAPPGTQVRMPVTGWDQTFNCPKSISLAWALADEPTRQAIHECFVDSIADSLAWMEDHSAWTRTGKGGIRHERVQGLTAVRFDHMDNRDGEPHLHSHLLVSNVAVRADGRRGALDGRSMLESEVAVSERHTDTLMRMLHDRLGFDFEPRVHRAPGGRVAVIWEVRGISDDMIDRFSRRRRDLARRADELAAAWSRDNGGKTPDATTLSRLADQAWRDTRRPKDKPDEAETQRDKLDRWEREAAPLMPDGMTPAQWVSSLRDLDPRSVPPSSMDARRTALDAIRTLVARDLADRAGHLGETPDPSDVTDGQALDWIASTTQEGRTTFSRSSVLATVHRMLRGIPFSSDDPAGADRIAEGIADDVCARLVPVTPGRYSADAVPRTLSWGADGPDASIWDVSPRRRKYVTPLLRDAELEFVRLARERTGAPSAQDVERAVRAADDAMEARTGHPLAADQRDCVTRILSDPHAVTALTGPAGSGKTTTMQGLLAAVSALDPDARVLGISPTARGAAELSASLRRPCNTVAAIITEADHGACARRVARLGAIAADGTRPYAQRSAARMELAAATEQLDALTIPRGGLVIVDEASMADTVQAARLARLCAQAGARMLMVGDPLQLGSPGIGGGCLQWLEDHGQSAALTGIYRFRTGSIGEADPLPADGDAARVESTGWIDAGGTYHPVPGDGAFTIPEGGEFAYRLAGDAPAHATLEPGGEDGEWTHTVTVWDGDDRTVCTLTRTARYEGGPMGGREADASTLLRTAAKAPDDGRPGRYQATREYMAMGRVHAGVGGSAADRAFGALYRDMLAGRDSILVALDNDSADEINERMSIMLRNTVVGHDASGAPVYATCQDPSLMLTLGDGVRYGPGDVICTRKVARSLVDTEGGFVRNGDLWTIRGADRGRDGRVTRVTLERRGGTARVTVDASWLARNAQGGYAATAQRDQGITVDRAYAVIGPGASPSARTLYVAMTRGRHGNDLFVDLPDLTGADTDTAQAAGELRDIARRKAAALEAQGRKRWTGAGPAPADGAWYTGRDLLPSDRERAADAIDRILDTHGVSELSVDTERRHRFETRQPDRLLEERAMTLSALASGPLADAILRTAGPDGLAALRREEGWDSLAGAWLAGMASDPGAASAALDGAVRDAIRALHDGTRDGAPEDRDDLARIRRAVERATPGAADVRFLGSGDPALPRVLGDAFDTRARAWLSENDALLRATMDDLERLCRDGHGPVWTRKLGRPPAPGAADRGEWERLLADTALWRAWTGSDTSTDPLPHPGRGGARGLAARDRLRDRWRTWAGGARRTPAGAGTRSPDPGDPFLDTPAPGGPDNPLARAAAADAGARAMLEAAADDAAWDWAHGAWDPAATHAAAERVAAAMADATYAAPGQVDAAARGLYAAVVSAARIQARRYADAGLCEAGRRARLAHADPGEPLDVTLGRIAGPGAAPTHILPGPPQGMPPEDTGRPAPDTPEARLASRIHADPRAMRRLRAAAETAARDILAGREWRHGLDQAALEETEGAATGTEDRGTARRAADSISAALRSGMVRQATWNLAMQGVGRPDIRRAIRRDWHHELAAWMDGTAEDPPGDPWELPEGKPSLPPAATMRDAWERALARTVGSPSRRTAVRAACTRLGISPAGIALLAPGDPVDAFDGIDAPTEGHTRLLAATRGRDGSLRRVTAIDTATGECCATPGSAPGLDGLDDHAIDMLRKGHALPVLAGTPLERLRIQSRYPGAVALCPDAPDDPDAPGRVETALRDIGVDPDACLMPRPRDGREEGTPREGASPTPVMTQAACPPSTDAPIRGAGI